MCVSEEVVEIGGATVFGELLGDGAEDPEGRRLFGPRVRFHPWFSVLAR